MKYESNTLLFSKDIARKPFFIWRSRAITLIIISGLYPYSNLTCILWLYLVYEIWIQFTYVFKRYRPETIFQSEIKGHNSDNNRWILYGTWPVFNDYIPVYEIWIQCTNVIKRYRPETIFHSEIKGHNSDNNRWISSVIELDLYLMIIYMCMKYESNAPMYSKDIARKPFFVCTDVRTRVMLYAPPPTHYKWRGHNKS